MRKLLLFIYTIAVLFSLAACNNARERPSERSINNQTQPGLIADENNSVSQPETQPEFQSELPVKEEEPNMLKTEIIVGDRIFSATFYDNEAAKAIMELFPMTLNMSELNGNEKYYYLENNLPTNSSIPSSINAGDIMIYNNNCLVLFYDSFSTSYSYTPLGHIDDPQGLTEALGSGSVQVTFKK